ncbi:hypothetical protein FGO68_gene10026 [Halteria grandinella]|uniref:Uncharacterized protein n=1 Tax=Halteria grandinella TaxID=5974 RepID=A0A8J8P3K3_HALGN|nr:hypothetical protein FGO68_gene10026 [Halteria grandinella]
MQSIPTKWLPMASKFLEQINSYLSTVSNMENEEKFGGETIFKQVSRYFSHCTDILGSQIIKPKEYRRQMCDSMGNCAKNQGFGKQLATTLMILYIIVQQVLPKFSPQQYTIIITIQFLTVVSSHWNRVFDIPNAKCTRPIQIIIKRITLYISSNQIHALNYVPKAQIIFSNQPTQRVEQINSLFPGEWRAVCDPSIESKYSGRSQ